MDALTTLNSLGGGKFLEQLADLMAGVASDVVRTGKKGSVAATITIEPLKDGAEVIVTAAVQPKPPAERPQGAVFFALDGELHRNDPRQTAMEFRIVDEATGEIRGTVDEAQEIRRVAE